MPRNPDGSYGLPNPDVQPGEVISSSWANTTMNDIAQALEESLSRDGEGGMRAALPFGNGDAGGPGITWAAEITSGFYRAGTGDMRVSILGTDIFRWTNGNVQIWTGAAWADVVYQGGTGGMPDGSAIYQTLAWDNTGQVWVPNSAFTVNYSNGDIANTRDLSVGRNLTVQAAFSAGTTGFIGSTLTVTNDIVVGGTVDGVDISAFNTSYLSHVADTNIHYADAPNDGSQYARRNNAWVEVAATGQVIPPGTQVDQSLRWDGGAWALSSEFQIKDGSDAIAVTGGNIWLGANANTSIRTSAGNVQTFVSAVEQTVVENGRMGIGTSSPNTNSRLDVNGAIYTENLPLVLNAKRFAVVSALPGGADADTIYFIAPTLP